MRSGSSFNALRSLLGVTGLGFILLGVAGCTTAPDSAPPGGHVIGYQDTPPVAPPPSAPGTPKTNDPSNPLPPGGVTVQPSVISPDEHSSGTMQNRTSSP